MKGRTGREVGAAGAAVAGVGAAVSAAASACCVSPVVAPLLVSVLGASGAAWAAGLKPYRPYLLAGSLGLLIYGFWTVYRRRPACAPDDGSARPSRSPRWVRVVLWSAAVLWVVSLTATVYLGS